MKFKLIIPLFLFLANGLKLTAAVKYTLIIHHEIAGSSLIFLQDSIKNEFNQKKKNTKVLLKDVDPEAALRYFEFYLDENDRIRADSLLKHMVTVVDDVQYRLRLSLISSRYGADPKTQLLFLSDHNRIQLYRSSLAKSGESLLKSNADKRAYYHVLVSLDSAVYESTQDSLVKKQLSHHYNSLAWLSILTQKLDGVEYYLNQSLKYDPEYKYPHSNLPLLLLLKGHYKEARKLYIQYKDLQLDTPNITYRDGFLEDFAELAKVGVKNKNIEKITKLLNSGK